MQIVNLFKQIKHNKGDNSTSAKRFENLMERAKKIQENDKASNQMGFGEARGIEDLIVRVLDPIKALYKIDAYYLEEHSESRLDSLHFEKAFFGDKPCYFDAFYECQLKEFNEKIYLATDIILPKVWSPFSMTQVIGKIGHNRYCGSFKQDFTNHRTELVLPFKVTFVAGGNHSIAQGTLQHDATLVPDNVYDLTPVLKDVIFDGEKWQSSRYPNVDGRRPKYPEFGYVWELAKLLH